VIYSAKL